MIFLALTSACNTSRWLTVQLHITQWYKLTACGEATKSLQIFVSFTVIKPSHDATNTNQLIAKLLLAKAHTRFRADHCPSFISHWTLTQTALKQVDEIYCDMKRVAVTWPQQQTIIYFPTRIFSHTLVERFTLSVACRTCVAIFFEAFWQHGRTVVAKK